MFATLHAHNYNCDFPFASGPRIMYVHVQALYNWWFARNLLAILVSRQSGFYLCPGFVFIVTNRVVLSYSTNMLVFRPNTNLLCTNVAWLSNLWLYPRLVGVSRYLGWHYWCYYLVILAVGGDVLITRPLIDIKVVPWVWATQVAIHTFARGKKLCSPYSRVSLFCTWSQNGTLVVDWFNYAHLHDNERQITK